MFLTITTVNNKTYYAFYNTQSEKIVLNDLNNKKFIEVTDIDGYRNFLQTDVIESFEVYDSKDALLLHQALEKFEKRAGVSE